MSPTKLAPRRSPVRHPIPAQKGKKAAKKKIAADPLKEYAAALQQEASFVQVLTLSDDDCLAHVKRHISTRSLALDRLMNRRGVPCGRIVEVFGPPHVGKSTISDQIIASAQAEGGYGILIDTEASRDVEYSRNLGVDPGRLQYIQFKDDDTTVEAVSIAIDKSLDFWTVKYPDDPVVLVWDALGSTKTREEAAKDFDTKKSPGGAARVMRLFQRVIPPRLGNTNVCVVILNHEYQKIGMTAGVGVKKETYGGDALRLMASIRLQLYYAGDYVKNSDGTILGKMVGAKLVKNRLGPSPVETTVAMMNGTGTNNVIEVYERLKAAGIIQLSGSWSGLNLDGKSYNFQGWRGLQELCSSQPEVFAALVKVYWSTP